MNTLHRAILAVVSCALFFHVNGQDSARHEPRLGIQIGVSALTWPGNSDLTEGRIDKTPNEVRLAGFNDGPANGGTDGFRSPVTLGVLFRLSSSSTVGIEAAYQEYSFREDRYAYTVLPKVRVNGSLVRTYYFRPLKPRNTNGDRQFVGSWGGALLFHTRDISMDPVRHPYYDEVLSLNAHARSLRIQGFLRLGLTLGRSEVTMSTYANLMSSISAHWARHLDGERASWFKNEGTFRYTGPFGPTLINDLTFSYSYYFQ